MATAKDYGTRHRAVDPSKCALLVIDVQKRFSSVTVPILPTINRTISLCRSVNIPVIFIRHVDDPNYKVLPELWGPVQVSAYTEDPTNDFLSDLAVEEGDVVLEKSTYCSFQGTGLEEKLREMGVEEVIVTGVNTNICCETSARAAFVRDFRVFFSTDATNTSSNAVFSSDDLRDAALTNLAFAFAYLVNCDMLEAGFMAKA